MEKLPEYLRENSITQSQFADRIGRKQALISKLCTGEANPSLETALAIERETGGAVPVESWNAFKGLGARNANQANDIPVMNERQAGLEVGNS